MTKRLTFLLLAALVVSGAAVHGQQLGGALANDAKAAMAMKTGAMSKCGPALASLHHEFSAHAASGLAPAEFVSANPVLNVVDGYVTIDAVASGALEALMVDLEALGIKDASSYGRVVSGRVPIGSLESVAGCATLQFARPAAAMTNVGLVTSQGDRSMRTDEVRAEFDVDGAGTRVGVLSDSYASLTGPLFPGNPFTTAAQDQANDDLPADVIVLSDLPPGAGSDEGRAMMQLIHDAAPGAAQAFHSAFFGQADFASGIVELATDAGSDVIVDDVIYFAEPMFADGIIAQAADTVRGLGVPYYSSAGNQAR
ncbi:MAG: peptidase S8, partial [Thermoanaerobaculia bacterium]